MEIIKTRLRNNSPLEYVNVPSISVVGSKIKRLPIVVTGKDVKQLFGVPELESSTGRD